MNGVVTGGWGFVWSAYIITATAFLIYGVTLVTRLREVGSGTSKERQTQ
jgi:hypothetical protein